MSENEIQHFVGLDIGTNEVKCVVGSLDSQEDNRLSIIGHGVASNSGMRKGTVVRVGDVIESVVQAVTEAERISGFRINRATVNVNGPQVLGMNSRGVIAISAANREITAEDRLRVEEAATIVKLPSNREIIQVFAKNYRLDGQTGIKDPLGMSGVRLEVDTHIVTASTPTLKNLDLVLEKSHLQANHHTVSSLAAAEAVLSKQQKDSGTALIDIGAGTTNLVVLEEGEVSHVAVIPMGGINITNDLAIGLKTDLDIADRVKIEYGALNKKNKKAPISFMVNKTRHEFSNEEVEMIIEARIEEIFEYVDKELKKIQRSRKLPGGVVLVGGTANLGGIADFAKEKLQLAARIGKIQDISGLIDTVQSPKFATAVGLMMLDLYLGESTAPSQEGQTNSNFFGMIEGLIKRVRK